MYHLNPWMDFVDTLPDVRYWSEVLCCTITTDTRVQAMGWGWRSKYRTSSYSGDFEFFYLFIFLFFFCFKCILVLLARHSSGELRCPATALNVDVLYVCTKVRLINKSMQSRKFSIHILKTIRLTLNYYSIILQYLPQQGKDTWKLVSVSWVSIMLNKRQVDKHQLSISFENLEQKSTNSKTTCFLDLYTSECTLNPFFFSHFLDKAITQVSTFFFCIQKSML